MEQVLTGTEKEMFVRQSLSPRLLRYSCSQELSLTKTLQTEPTPLWTMQRGFYHCSLRLHGVVSPPDCNEP